ncbi:MAG: DUF3842 family protein [Oscillospiraceae bacterium]|nr:DUF3842 family protein [Oscillospiraceae bacterium]
MKILVIDGQGGRIGKALVEELRRRGFTGRITAVGTNSAATAAMLKAGADEGATGENPVVVGARRADVIMGPMGIVAANSLLGEITPAMALAVSESEARKVLVPVNRCRIRVAGVQELPLGEYTALAAQLALQAEEE